MFRPASVPGIACVLWLGIATVPLPPQGLGVGLDASWGYGLNLAHVNNLEFGRDIVFTFGPLGYLTCPDPELAAPRAVMALAFAAYLLLMAAVIRFVRYHPSRLAGLFAGVCFAAAAVFTRASFDLLQVAVLAWCASTLMRPGWAGICVAGVAAGVLALVKVNDGVVACCVYLCVLSAWAWTATPRRLDPRKIALAALPGVVVLAYFAARGASGAVFPYVFNSLNMAAGYSEAMSLPGPMWQLGLAVLTILYLFIAVPALADQPLALTRSAAPALTIAFFAFKHAMVRQDVHAEGFHLRLAIAGLMALICAATSRDRRLLGVFAVMNLALGLAVIYDGAPWFVRVGLDRFAMRGGVSNLRAWIDLDNTWKVLRDRNAPYLNKRIVTPQAAAAVGSNAVDAVPSQTDIVRANGWKWQPRPVFQSYAAYTPQLDRMNADFIEAGKSAPRVVLEWNAIDGRHPFFEDAAAWRALVDRYDLQFQDPRMLVLRKRDGPRYSQATPAGSRTADWNENIPLPRVDPGSFVIMTADIRKSLLGTIEGLLLRVAPIYLEAGFTSGKTVRARVVRANLINGAFISDLPLEGRELLPFLERYEAGLPDRVEWIRFASDAEAQFSRAIRIAWSRVTIRDSAEALRKAATPPAMKLIPLYDLSAPHFAGVGAEVVVARASVTVKPTRLDPMVLFTTNQNLRQFKTLLFRVRFSSGGRINLFFGKQVDGRGIEGSIPATSRWLDVYMNVASNLFWADEAGSTLRFDPPDESTGTTIEIAGIWGSKEAMPAQGKAMVFYPAD